MKHPEADVLPRYFHAHHERQQEDHEFWKSIAASQGGPILELGCGTGRLTLPLARTGNLVIGLDRDASMLAELRAWISEDIRACIHVFQADMTRFHLAARFHLILLPCNTLSTLPSVERPRLFDAVRQHLAPGGLFAASLPNPNLLASLPTQGEPELEEVFIDPQTGDPVQVSSAWERRESAVTVTWHYDRLDADGTVTRYTLSGRHDLASLETYAAELHSAGLSLQAAFGNFDAEPYNSESPFLILIARILER